MVGMRDEDGRRDESELLQKKSFCADVECETRSEKGVDPSFTVSGKESPLLYCTLYCSVLQYIDFSSPNNAVPVQ